MWLWMCGLRGVPSQQAGVFTLTLLLAVAAVGIGWLGEAATLQHGVALVAALVGVYLATRPDVASH
ncbi:MAG: EamA family transporter [Inhella sp.]|uniref:EamA family transporter n=1 Tax=Inhella sp. TaxID=1921806 RepID=UPI0022C4E8AE|nr:EamA family transporter [Inhella sp.]MCZ8234610.1 EamA family transporter [Inhella sp.]